MKNQFDWQVGELDEEGEEPIRAIQTSRLVSSFWFMVAAVLITGLLIGGWRVGQAQLARSERKLKQQIQTILDLEHQAVLDGDGDLFFSVLDNDPAWKAAQLLPENQSAHRAGLKVTRVQPQGEFVWANVSWRVEDQNRQRISFFEWQENRLVHVATDPAYWSNTLRSRHAWGELVYQQVDDAWANTVAFVVADLVEQICAIDCLPDRLGFTMVLAADYAGTAAPGQIRLPSPRLIGLTEEGKPASLFWDILQQHVEAHLRPATIRFAVPPSSGRDGLSDVNYQQFADRFMAEHPEIRIEIVNLQELPDDLSTLATEFDAVAIPPTKAMLAAGLVRDLSDYIESDPGFDQADFYEQIWQGTLWQGRTWFMPQWASMRVIFYDKQAYRRAGFPEPSLRWTWDEMAKDVSRLVAAQPEGTNVVWGYLDTELDSLYSFAFNWNNQCTESVTVFCQNELLPANIAASFDWYRQMAGQPGLMQDVTGMTPAEREYLLYNSQTTRRKAVIWVDRPANYELQFLLANLGVISFPGSDRFDGITPLWMGGSFISQESKYPLAVWQWLNFLSYQRPVPRLVPARPSVADATQFWAVLPQPLGDAMRAAFPFARPVTVEEQTLISWEQLSAVMAGDLSPIEAAQRPLQVEWFRNFSQNTMR